ncbi:MAG: hypothetical protein NT150_00920 [Bacteroidetes bacterium]|nr:hypothetical protein [Bacteroidota bacterium]
MKVLCKHISFIVLLLLAAPAFAQSDSLVYTESYTPASAYEEENVKQHEFDEAKWKKLTKELDYSIEEEKNNNVNKKPDSLKDPNWNINPAVVKIIFWVFIGAVAVFLLILFIRHRYSSPKNYKIKSDKSVVSDFIPENIAELNLEAMLLDLSKASSYREAIRIYYLIVLRDLHTKNLIVLKKNSISREFLQALHGHSLYRRFFEVNRLFEKVWYGDIAVDASNYSAASALFEDFIKAINSVKK